MKNVEPQKKPPTRRRAPDAAPRPQFGKDPVISLPRLRKLSMALRLGNYITTSVKYAGISEATYHKWRVRGEYEMDRVEAAGHNLDKLFEGFDGVTIDEKTGEDVDKSGPEYMWRHKPRPFDPIEWPYVVFVRTTVAARHEAEVRAVSNIVTAGRKQWQASAWWLERSFPDRYGRVDRMELTGKDGGAVQTEGSTTITVENVNDMLKSLLKPEGGAKQDG